MKGTYRRSEEQKRQLAEANRQRVWSEESRAKLSRAHKGKAISAETRAKNSAAQRGKPKPAQAAAMRGRKQSAETRAKRSATMKRVLAAKPKTQTKPDPFDRYNDPAYLEWRAAVFARAGYRCQDCGRQYSQSGRWLRAHHILPWATHPAERYNLDNGRALCQRCHLAAHGMTMHKGETRAPEPPVPCACGCGTMIDPRTRGGKPRRFVAGHVHRGRTRSPEMRAKIAATLTGRPLPPEQAAKLAARMQSPEYRARQSALMTGKPSAMRGKTHTPEARAKMSAARAGKTRRPHSEETRAKMSASQKARLATKAR